LDEFTKAANAVKRSALRLSAARDTLRDRRRFLRFHVDEFSSYKSVGPALAELICPAAVSKATFQPAYQIRPMFQRDLS